jgi:hypothetical protein
MSLRNKLSRLQNKIVVESDCFCGKTVLDLHYGLKIDNLVPCRYCQREGEVFRGMIESAQTYNEKNKIEVESDGEQ